MNKLSTFLLIISLLIAILSCNNPTQSKTNKTTNSFLKPTLRISIPQESGEIFVNYKIFEINNDSLFVIDRMIQVGQLNVDSMYRYDTIEKYKLDQERITELGNIISKIDSLGDHRPKGYYLPMGWPRFNISASIKNKNLHGSISNCYRENIYSLVDFLNTCYPKGKAINYNKQEIIELEMKLARNIDE